MSMLINEGVYGSLQPYYELVRGDDLSALEALLLHSRSLSELLVKSGILRQDWKGYVLADCL